MGGVEATPHMQESGRRAQCGDVPDVFVDEMRLKQEPGALGCQRGGAEYSGKEGYGKQVCLGENV